MNSFFQVDVGNQDDFLIRKLRIFLLYWFDIQGIDRFETQATLYRLNPTDFLVLNYEI